ncbi:3'-5' exonuclease [Methylobacterium sp. SD274]|uniref:3'-5' exonuclease n=1 Tax=Methylobacterium sp. SD274 TaxID=2782009 RepID=UPI001A970283|nr:3'-5' exonuclease [Methylobacterium sp. SD274]
MIHPLDSIASVLESTGEYRVLRRVGPFADCTDQPTEPTFIGLILDTETTGVDHTHDEVIELGMIKFEYGASGRIYRVLQVFNQLQEPQKPIPPEVTRLTGITDADVAGQRINDAAVRAMAGDAVVVIAHNASFDRQFCESRWPIFVEKNWACSCYQVPWRNEGHEGMKLGYLLTDYGFFHKGHRAIDDCHALRALLAAPLKTSGRLALACLLETARKPTLRIWAAGSPIATKDVLKARSYRWSGRRRCWYIDVEEELFDIERAFLSQEIFQGEVIDLPTERITARDRFSIRVNPEASD